MSNLRSRFELKDEEFEQLVRDINQLFGGSFRGIRYIYKAVKAQSPGYLVAQNGDFILTSDHRHTRTGFNALLGNLPPKFEMIRSWSDYGIITRDWGWGDLQ